MGLLPESPGGDITLRLSKRAPRAEVHWMGNQPVPLQEVCRLKTDALTNAMTSYTLSAGILRTAVPPNKQNHLSTKW